MIDRLKKSLGIVVLLIVLFANGLHVAALQGYAWTMMFLEYSETLDTAGAFEATFSGRELCGVCLVSQEVKAETDEALSDFLAMGKPLLLLLLCGLVMRNRIPSTRDEAFVSLVPRLLGRRAALDPPPPRIFAY